MAAADEGHEKTVGEQNAVRETWKTYLDEELRDFESGSVDEAATIVIRDVLEAESASEDLFEETALRLDKYDRDVRIRCDPIQTIINLAKRISYDDEKQDRLIRLLKELMKFSQPGSNYEMDLSGILEKTWNGLYPTLNPSITDPEETEALLKTKCAMWLNWSVFRARILAAGICVNYENWSFKAPSRDVAIGLTPRHDITGGVDTFTNCTLMVAAQYILVAGEVIRSKFTKSEGEEKGWNQAHWKQWTEGFREASDFEYVKEETRLAAKEAYNKMVALWPEIFVESEQTQSKEAEDLESGTPGSNS